MLRYFQEKFQGKTIALLGFGLEGQSTYKFFRKYLPTCHLQIMDQNQQVIQKFFEGVREQPFIYEEENYLQFKSSVDYIFKSPGIPLKELAGIEGQERITSQTHEFIMAYREQVIGITGTKGKSTTCAFLYRLLELEGKQVLMVGNMGRPAFDYIDAHDPRTYYIYELSSHQLETTYVSPKYSVILNIFQEHLDHYRSYEDYVKAKMAVAKFQKGSDYLIYSTLTEDIQVRLADTEGIRLPITKKEVDRGIEVLEDRVVSKWASDKVTLYHEGERKLKGKHNLINMAAAVLITQILGCDQDSIRETCIQTFEGLPHRLAYVDKIAGVTYYNDSIATIPQATLEALEAIEHVGTLIIGGMDRGVDYSQLVMALNSQITLKIILLPEVGHKLYQQIAYAERLYKVSSMEEAVRKAKEITEEGQVCLLSPAAASYGFYKDFQERGRDFESLVRGIEDHQIEIKKDQVEKKVKSVVLPLEKRPSYNVISEQAKELLTKKEVRPSQQVVKKDLSPRGKGFISLLLGIMGLMMACFPFVGISLSTLAISVAKKDLKAHSGMGSYGGKGMVISGMVLGIVGTVIGLFATLIYALPILMDL